MDGGGEGSINSLGSSSEKLVYVPTTRTKTCVKAPNKKKHEAHLAELHQLITSKEERKRSVLDSQRESRDQLNAVREARETFNAKKNVVFEKLDFINKEAQKKGEQVQKLRGGIVYSKEAEVDHQIRKLEYQIQKNNFKLAEEKRIVSEIDRLRRSKKALKEYIAVKQESDDLRDRQRALRDERESIFRESRDIRRTEDAIRFRIKENNDQLEMLKQDIDHYREEKRSLVNAFKHQDNQYRNYQMQQREELKQKAQAERDKREAEERKEIEEIRSSQEPFHEEQNLCRLLLNYCQALLGPQVSEQTLQDSNLLLIPTSVVRRRSSGFSAYTTNSEASSRYATPLGCTPAGTPLNGTPPGSIDAGQPGFYKKKDDQEPIFFPGSKKNTKKSRAERKMSLKKSLSHSPETFQQFSLLHLTPPSSLLEVKTVLELIKAKLKLFQRSADQDRMLREEVCPLGGGGTMDHPLIMIEPARDEAEADYSREHLMLNLQHDSETYSREHLKLNLQHDPESYSREHLTLNLQQPNAHSCDETIRSQTDVGPIEEKLDELSIPTIYTSEVADNGDQSSLSTDKLSSDLSMYVNANMRDDGLRELADETEKENVTSLVNATCCNGVKDKVINDTL